MSDPEFKKVRAIDVVPNHWAVWCSIRGDEPFANPIEHVSWSEDGERLRFMLATHNFYDAKPDEEMDIIPVEPSEYGRESGLRQHAEFLRKQPTPEQVELRRERKRIEDRLREIDAALREDPFAPSPDTKEKEGG